MDLLSSPLWLHTHPLHFLRLHGVFNHILFDLGVILSTSRCDGRVFFGLDGTCLEHFGSNLRPAQVPQQLCFPCSSSSLCIFGFISCIFMVVSSFSHCMV